jgi:LAO/AO transport system kinase
MPESGDDIQAAKAGILEIADLFVVNKADREGADLVVLALEKMLDLSTSDALRQHPRAGLEVIGEAPAGSCRPSRRPVVRKAAASKEQGIDDVIDGIEDHLSFLKSSGQWNERERLSAAMGIDDLLHAELLEHMLNRLEPSDVSALIDAVARRELDPHRAVKRLLEGI